MAGAGNLVMIAVDLTGQSPRVISEGLRLAAHEGASALIVHVIDDRFPYPDLFSIDHPDANFFKTLRENALEHIRGWVALTEGRVPHEYLVARGKPSSTIVEIARSRRPSLLVMGANSAKEPRPTHPLGGTVERVAREAPCSIFIVVPPSE
jgi:nucleotide-binding universal stress UspA family protein